MENLREYRKRYKTGKDIEFVLSPVSKLPDKIMKQIVKRKRRGTGQYLSSGEYWDILHKMMREGKLIRYIIKGVCDVEAPRREREKVEEYKEQKYLLPNMRWI